jgi:hypothetical protein
MNFMPLSFSSLVTTMKDIPKIDGLLTSAAVVGFIMQNVVGSAVPRHGVELTTSPCHQSSW